MLLATGLLIEFGRFLQVLTWIMLPVLLLSVIITTWFHYRRKRKKTEEITNPVEDWLEVPADMDEGGKKGAYLLFDHSGLIRQYQHKLSYNEARYAALKHDFQKLELKYNSATGLAATRFTIENKNQMEKSTEKIQERIENLTSEFNAEKMDLLARLDQLDRSYKDLEKENESLLKQIAAQTDIDDAKELIANRWREENNLLKDQVAMQEYLKQVIGQQNAQIEFLQAQAEERVSSYNNSEMQIGNVSQLLHTQNDQLLYIENVLREVQQQNEMLSATAADSQEKIENLQDRLEYEQGKVKTLEQKLLANRQLLRRVYKEFSACLDEENLGSPVVTLRPSYASDPEWDETAVQ